MTNRTDENQTHHINSSSTKTQNKHRLEQLLIEDILPATKANKAANVLGVYPSKRVWLAFFDKALLVFGAVTLALSLVFFIAYNWINMGTLGKFGLVESALATSIISYTVLAYKQKHVLAQQLLLLVASITTGSLLALFGQVYQTGADTWQLFFNWALFITPWVLIARMPALWLMWLGLINVSFSLFVDITGLFLIHDTFAHVTYLIIMFVANFIVLNLWLVCTKTSDDTLSLNKLELHWSTYIVGLVVTYFATRLGCIHVINYADTRSSLVALLLWIGFAGFMYWQFRKRQIDLLMLTYLSGSAIFVITLWSFEYIFDNWDFGGLLLLTLLIIGMSSAVTNWLNQLRKMDNSNNTTTNLAEIANTSTLDDSRGDEHE